METLKKLRDNFNSPREVLLFGRIFFLITVLPLMVRFLTLPRLMMLLSRSASGADGTGNSEDYRNTIVKYTDYLLSRNFWVYRKTCLKRSLVLYHFLYPVFPGLGICFGVRTKQDSIPNKRRALDGHSWLTHKGEIFLEEQPDLAKKYTVTYHFPEKPSASKTSNKDFHKLSNENRLLLYCARVGVSKKTATQLNDLLSTQLNWEFISRSARSHNISQLLYHNLKALPNSSFIPAGEMQEFKKIYHETVARNIYIYAELKAILDAFRRSGIEAIALKGAALAGVVYPDIGLRPMLDIDLLVREDELPAADKVMAELGYSVIHGVEPEQWYRENHFHLPPYQHPRKVVIVEIHWHVTRNSHGTDIRKWWERAENKNIMGYPVLVPSSEDMLIHLSVHLFHHAYNKGFVLRGLCDIYEMIQYHEGELNWKLLRDKITNQGIEKQVHSILELAVKFYAPQDECFVPINLDHADLHFLRVLENRLFADKEKAPVNPHLLKSMMFSNFGRKMGYLLAKIFLSPQEMSRRYPASPFPMMFVHYLIRPFHLLARYGRSAAEMYRAERKGKE
jgi:hypothetical protein